MAKQLHLKLNQVHKSFEIDFEHNFSGDLIVLSGVNGSGKTQLIDIIRGHKSENIHDKINRTITLDGVNIDDTVIAHKSFRDYSSIGELTGAQVSNLFGAINTIFDWYKSFKLDFNHPNAGGYKDVVKRSKILLIKKFGEEKFNSGSITREEFKDAIPRDFVLFQDDIFTNKIGEIFFNYVSLVHNKKAEAGENGTKFDNTNLPIAPWKILNELFAKLKFEYRFKDSYQRVNDEISDQPAIYPVKDDGTIDLGQKRLLFDLSDGEKALISLTFAVLASEQTQPKILLLDEYDATLNPSLTSAFFIILEEFFIKNNIQVVVVTHSSSTLSLSPEYTSFYEVYKPKNNRPRVLQVQRDQYEELEIANRKFYDRIGNQDNRYKEIEAENIDLKEVVAKLQISKSDSKLQIVTEGHNIQHIKKALSIYCDELLDKIELVSGAENKTGKQQLKNAFEIFSKISESPRALFVWDCDASDIVESLQETDSCHKFCFEKNLENTKMKKGIENLYANCIFTEEIYNTTNEECDDGVKSIKRVDKTKFLAKAQSLTEPDDFINFKPLIKKIESTFDTLTS
jgi:ABC-type branched-subunit amino acid transport system ATPase component